MSLQPTGDERNQVRVLLPVRRALLWTIILQRADRWAVDHCRRRSRNKELIEGHLPVHFALSSRANPKFSGALGRYFYFPREKTSISWIGMCRSVPCPMNPLYNSSPRHSGLHALRVFLYFSPFSNHTYIHFEHKAIQNKRARISKTS